MKIHIYDTHVHSNSGQYIHFDILVNDENINQIKAYAENYLLSLGIQVEHIEQSRCNFCHSEIANPKVKKDILTKGHSIIRL